MSDLSVRKSGHNWAVFRGNFRISPLLSSQLVAEDWRSREEQSEKQQTRSCMCCQQSFVSEGWHNRLCDKCRTKSEGLI